MRYLSTASPAGRERAVPELDIAVTAFLLHFVWEFWQVPWYAGMREIPHVEGIYICSRAAFGDAAIALFSHGVVAAFARNRFWFLAPSAIRTATFLGVGLMVTVLLEWLATDVFDRWEYADAMPTLPVIGTGFAPLLQWLALPIVTLIILRRLWAGSADFREGRLPTCPAPSATARTRESTAARD